MSSCQLMQQSDAPADQQPSAQQSKDKTVEGKERIIGYPITGNRTVSMDPQNHQPVVIAGTATAASAQAATTATPAAKPSQPATAHHPISSPAAATQLDTPEIPTSGVQVATGGQNAPWLGGTSTGNKALPDLDLGDAPFAPSAMLISPMRHPKTPGINTPAEEDGSTKRELAPRPNTPELRGLRAPKLKPVVPLPHEAS